MARPIVNVVPLLTSYMCVRATPKQLAFLLLFAKEAFYGGAAGGGKSMALLLAALQYVDIPGYAALIVRRNFGMLEQPGGLIELSMRLLAGTDAIWDAAEHTWRFPSGAKLVFRHFQDASAEQNFYGGQYQFIAVDEVTDLSEREYLILFSRLRRLEGFDVPTRMRCASNPMGPGKEWVQRRFIIEQKKGRAFIAARLEDNPYLDQEDYEENLRQLPSLEYEQLRNGNWDIKAGGTLFLAEWFDPVLLDKRDVPEGLSLARYWDPAATEPIKGRDPDHTAGVLLGRSKDGATYVLDVVRARKSSLGVERLIAETAEKDKARDSAGGVKILMEQEGGASGKALIDHYSRNVLAPYDFSGVSPSGSKEVRAAPVAARVEQGNLLIVRASWTSAFLDELISFPFGAHDDQVDALSGAYEYLAGKTEVPTNLVFPDMTVPSYFRGDWSVH